MKPRRRAQQTARAAALPQKQEARQELRQGRRANRAAYGALDRTLEEIGGDYRKDYRQLGTGLRQGLSGLSSMMNVAGGMGGAVGGSAFGGIGASAIRGLGQQRSRGVEATRSTRTQGAIERKTNALNLLSAFQQRMQDISNQQGANVQALIPEYQQQRFNNRMQRQQMSLAERELEMQEEAAAQQSELSDWYLQNLQNQRQRQQARQGGGGGGGPQSGYPVQGGADAGYSGVMGGAGRAAMQHGVGPGAGGQSFKTAAERPVRAGGGGPAPRAAMAAPMQRPAPAPPMRDPFQPPPAAGGPQRMAAAPSGGAGNGYWYQDPQTGQQMYSTGGGVADNAAGEIDYWQSVLKQGGAQNPQLSNMIHRQIAELEALRSQ